MDRFQKNTIKSFRKVKEDVKNLQAQVIELIRKLEFHEKEMHGHKKKDEKR